MTSMARAIGPAPTLGPASLRERMDVVDILRGFAILGMLVVNFSHDLMWRWWFAIRWPDTLDHSAYFLLHLFASGKFHALFSFLFGWGFALQMGRAEARGVRFFPFYSRRLFVLLLIGLVNWIVLDWDSTLVDYAVCGYVLFLFRRRSLMTVLLAVALCSCYWPAKEALDVYGHAHQLADPRTAEATRQADARARADAITQKEAYLQLRAHGARKQIVASAAQEAAGGLFSSAYYLGVLGNPFPILLLGLYVGRRRILHDVPANITFLRKVFWWGLGLGLAGNAVGVWTTVYPGTYQAVWQKSWLGDAAFFQIGVPALCFCYASAIALLAQKPAWKRRLAPLAPVGRMALTNYLLQVVIFHLIGSGVGLFGSFGPLVGAFVGLAIFVFQALLSLWWVNNFRFGPVEWLWRTLTYGKLQPMRLARVESAVIAEGGL